MSKDFWMSIEVIPYPMIHIEVNEIGVACQPGGLVNNSVFSETINNPVHCPEPLGVCLLLNVTDEDVRFFWGNMGKPFDYSPFGDPFEINVTCPFVNFEKRGREDECYGKQECGTKIRLKLVPKIKQSGSSQDFIGEEKAEGSKESKWKKIFGVLFHPLKNMFF